MQFFLFFLLKSREEQRKYKTCTLFPFGRRKTKVWFSCELIWDLAGTLCEWAKGRETTKTCPDNLNDHGENQRIIPLRRSLIEASADHMIYVRTGCARLPDSVLGPNIMMLFPIFLLHCQNFSCSNFLVW